MAAANSVLRSQLNIKSVSSSVSSLSKGVDRAQKSAFTIGQTLIKRNRFKKDAISQDKLSFFKRREAVRRREQEGVIEAGQLSGSAKRTAVPMGAAIAESTKGFLSRMMDFVGNIFVGWLLGNLPTIINTAKNLITRIQTLSGILGRFVTDIGSIIFAFGDTLGAISSNVLGFDFGKEDRDVKTEFDKLNDAVSQLGTHFDEAINLLKTPLGQGPGEQENPEPPPAELTGQEAQPSAPPAPSGQAPSTGLSPLTGTSGTAGGAGRRLSTPVSPFLPGSGATITSGKGWRTSTNSYHRGYDVGARSGTPVYSYLPGVVTRVLINGKDDGGYGNAIEWKDDVYGQKHFYGHLLKVPALGVGKKFQEKTLLGYVGGTGYGQANRYADHLHWEIGSRGSEQDPGDWLRKVGLVPSGSTGKPSQPQTPMVPSGGKTPTAPPAPSGSGSTVNAQTVYSYLKSKGLGHNHIMGIIAGIDGESSFQVGVQEKGNSKQGVGLFQYTYPSRKQAFLSAVPDYKTNWKGQVDYAVFKDPQSSAYLSKQFSTPEEAAEWWLVQWERPREDLRGGRRTKYKQFISSFKPSGGQTSTTQSAQVAGQPSTPPAAEVSGPLTKEEALSIAGISQPDLNATGQMQALTPERTGTNVVITPQQAAPQAAPQQQGSSGPRMTTSEISPEIVLNRFMATRLLLDLAYT